MEHLRSESPTLAAAATGGSLSNRVHRLLGRVTPESDRPGQWLAGVLIATLMAVSLTLTAAEPPKTQSLENAPGWEWHIKPDSTVWQSLATRGMVLSWQESPDGTAKLNVAMEKDWSRTAPEYRPVAFDQTGKRYLFKPKGGAASKGVAMSLYALDKSAITRDQISYVGVEKMTHENRLKFLAPQAAQRAKAAGVEVLPFPTIGQPLPIDLTAMDGTKIRSADLKGKVVLVDCWATWCSPCMKKMPKLKAFYEKWHDKGFEIVGINFDKTEKTAKKTIRAQKLPWTQVYVPYNTETETLWKDAANISSLPRLLLIDQQGILHADCSPGQLEEKAIGLLKPNEQTKKDDSRLLENRTELWKLKHGEAAQIVKHITERLKANQIEPPEDEESPEAKATPLTRAEILRVAAVPDKNGIVITGHPEDIEVIKKWIAELDGQDARDENSNRQAPEDPERLGIEQKLHGTWTWSSFLVHGTITYLPDHTYRYEYITPNEKPITGKWQIENQTDLFYETPQPNNAPAKESRWRIESINQKELKLKPLDPALPKKTITYTRPQSEPRP